MPVVNFYVKCCMTHVYVEIVIILDSCEPDINEPQKPTEHNIDDGAGELYPTFSSKCL